MKTKLLLTLTLMLNLFAFGQTPTTNAPEPTCAAANVVSIYGDFYATNIATNYNPFWGQSGTVNTAFDPGTGNVVMAYTNFNYQGTDLISTNLSSMDFLHFDVWTTANPSATTLQVSPVNQGTGPTEVLVTVPYVQNAWTTISLPKSAFGTMTWDAVFQMKFAANGPGSTVPVDIYLDNIYFSTCGSAAPTQPTTNAPEPTCAAANVVSIYGDFYATNIATNYNPFWGQSGTVNTNFNPGTGNVVMAYTNFNYQGTELVSTDLSSMDFLHFDVWTTANPSATTLQVSPINQGTGPAEVLVTVPYVQGEWTTITLPKSAFGAMTWDAVFQMKFAANGPGSTVPVDIYLDNIYFSTCGVTPPPVAPNQPVGFVVNTPTESSAFLACGPNNVGANDIVYKLFYSPTATAPANPLDGTEYIFGSTGGDGNGTAAFGFNLTGLDAATEYTFCLYQYNTVGQLYSTPSCLNITTSGSGIAPNQPVGFVVNTPTESSAFLACGPNNAGANDIVYKLFYSPTATAPANPLDGTEYIFGSTGGDGNGTAAFGFTLSGLDAATEYTFCLYQYNTVGQLYSTPSCLNITTSGGGIAPTEPVGFVVQNPSSESAFLAVGPNNVGMNNIVYKLFYSPTATAPANPLDGTEYIFGSTPGDGNGTSAFGFNLSGLEASTEYTFCLYQYNSVGELYSTPSCLNITTLAAPVVPTTNAPNPTCPVGDVVSIYGDFYATNIATNYNPNWGQSGFGFVNPNFDPGTGNEVLAYPNFNYQGTDLITTDLSSMEFLNFDVFTNADPAATTLQVSPINQGTGPAEVLVTVPFVQGQWTSISLPKSAFGGMTWDAVFQMKFAANGPGSFVPIDLFLDNIFFSGDCQIDAPVNDQPCGALDITSSGQTDLNTYAFLADMTCNNSVGNNESTSPSVVGASCGGTSGRSMWYTFTTPSCDVNGVVPFEIEFSTNNLGTNFNTKLAIFESNDNDCDGIFTELACNDDHNGAGNPALCDAAGATTSTIVTNLQPNKQYWVYVDGFNAEFGDFVLSGRALTPAHGAIATGGGTQIQLSTANMGAGLYTYYYKQVGSTGHSTSNSASALTNVRTLAPGNDYITQIMYRCGANAQASQFYRTAPQTIALASTCAVVNDMTCAFNGENSYTLSWTQPMGDLYTDGGLSGYRIKRSPVGSTGVYTFSNPAVVCENGTCSVTLPGNSPTGFNWTIETRCSASNVQVGNTTSCAPDPGMTLGNDNSNDVNRTMQHTFSFVNAEAGIEFVDVQMHDAYADFGLNTPMIGDYEIYVNDNNEITWRRVDASFDMSFDFIIVPNPSNAMTTVHLNTVVEAGTFTIVDAMGRTINSGAISNTDNINFDAAQLQSGVYMVVVTVEGVQMTKRLVVAE